MKKAVVLILFTLFLTTQANGENYYADITATGKNNGTSPVDAFSTITAINNHGFDIGDDLFFRCGQRWVINSDAAIIRVDWAGRSASDYADIGVYYMDHQTPVRSTDNGFTLSGRAKPVFDGQQNETDRGYPSDADFGIIHIGYRDYVSVSYLDVRNSGGAGIYVAYSNYCVIQHCDLDFIDSSAIMFNRSGNGIIEHCTATHVGTGHRYHGDADWGYAMGATRVQSSNMLIRYNKVSNCWSEGIGLYTGADNGIIEYNDVYGAQKVGIYLAESESNIVRYNKVYGTTDTEFHRRSGYAGQGIYTSHEQRTNHVEQNNEIYGNIVAYCAEGLRFGATDKGRHNGLVGQKIYNNTLVDNKIGVFIYGTDIRESQFYNNFVWNPSGGDTLLIDQYGNDLSGMTFRNNLWAKSNGGGPEASGARHASDPGYPSYSDLAAGLAKSSGWQSMTGGDLKISDCVLTAGSDAIGAGMAVAPPYDTLLTDASKYTDHPFVVVTAAQSGHDSPEIGAVIYTTGSTQPTPGAPKNLFISR